MAYRTTSWKNSDIGKIPSDWNVKKVKDYTDIVTGGTPSTQNGLFWGGDIRWMNSGELNKKNIYDVEKRITEEGLINSSTSLIPLKCVLVGLAGQGKTRGTVAMNFVPLCTNQSIAAILPNKTFDSKFVYHNLDNRYLELRSLSTGEGGRGGLNKNILLNVNIAMPSLPEQQKIAEVLTDLDDLIAELEKVRDKKQAIKIGAMQELLTGKRRLPGFNKPWKEVELGELLTYEQPQNYIVRSEEYRKTGTPVLTAGKTFVLGYTDEIDNIFSSVPVIIFDDFTTVSKFVNFPFKVKSSAIKILKLKNIEDNLKFIFEVMQITPFNLLNHQRYWISKYSKMSIKVPEYIEQTTIANILSDMDDEISAINDKINKYKQIKAGVADELLSGRIRLIKPQE